MIKRILQTCFALLLLIICLYSAKGVIHIFQLTIPGPLLGMLILLLLLSVKLIKPMHLSPAVIPILKYMALFFVPAGVGIIQYIPLFSSNLLLLLYILISIPCLGLFISGYIANKGRYRE
ncbi:CidA/LrgA family protein [Pseudoalteromonas sp. MMG013]|nr:CidA/LrgA family protein [Pseudoalteromonas sp. MMG013]